MTEISKEELLHIANLADLEIKEDEIKDYMKNLEEILNFANIVNSANVEDLDITIGANKSQNRFRKDEIVEFDNNEGLLENGKDVEQHMIKLPKVIN